MDRDRGTKSPGLAIFTPMGEPILQMAGRAQRGHLDGGYTCLREQHLIGSPQVEMNLAAAEDQMISTCVAESTLHLFNDIRAHRIVIGTDGWSNAGKQILGLGMVRALHGFNCSDNGLAHCTQPSGVNQTYRMLDRIMEQDRDAIGKPHKQRQMRLIGDDPIGFQGL